MKKKSLTILFGLIFIRLCFANPNNSMSLQYDPSPNATIASSNYKSEENHQITTYNAHSHTDITQVGTITSGVWQGTGVVLPSGALFFMVTGSCPTNTTDVTATYSNKFVRINATGGTTGGADTHSHTAGTYTVSPDVAIPAGTGADKYGWSTSGTKAVSGSSASGDNVPAYVTAKACQVN